MTKSLHILNGDGTAHNFDQSSWAADRLIWREMLMEGPVKADQGEDKFLKERASFVSAYSGQPLESYQDLFVPEFRMLDRDGEYEEIVLWFEYDLFCQANLWFLLDQLARRSFQGNISLISPGSHPEVVPFFGMGQLSPEQLAALYPTRLALPAHAIAFGSKVWTAFAGSPLDLQALALDDYTLPEEFPHLKPAIWAHLKRFPAISDGLNAIERFVVGALSESPMEPGELFRAFTMAHPEYGLGDVQFFAELKGLVPDWVQNQTGKMHLTESGRALAEGKENRLSQAFPTKWLGGYLLEPLAKALLWDEGTRRLVQAEKWY